jgi:hypothetical protein
MSRILIGIAALGLMGAASLPLQANAAERHDGITNAKPSTEVSAQRRHWRRHYGYRYYGPRRYWGPRYGYYGYPYGYYGYPYYYRPGPFVSFGFGPFGFRVF